MGRGVRVKQSGKPAAVVAHVKSQNHATIIERQRVVKLFKENGHLTLRDFVELYNSTESMHTLKMPKINRGSLSRWVKEKPPEKCNKKAKRSTHKSVVINLVVSLSLYICLT